MKFIEYISIISLILLISCDPCPEVDCANPFTDEELLWLPYSEGDKLIFLELNSSDSLIYRINYKQSGKYEPKQEGAPYCITDCFYQLSVTGNGILSNGEEERFGFGMYKFLHGFRLASGSGSNEEYEFNLLDAIYLDSLQVNDHYLKNVYKYTTYPMQEIVAETYMHQGKGLVKIKFRNGQDFELAEHIKASD